jgi:hypothetical protein
MATRRQLTGSDETIGNDVATTRHCRKHELKTRKTADDVRRRTTTNDDDDDGVRGYVSERTEQQLLLYIAGSILPLFFEFK